MADDHCHCQVSGESPEYVSLKTKLEDLESQQELLDTHQLYTRIMNITNWIEQLQQDLNTQNAVQEIIKRLTSRWQHLSLFSHGSFRHELVKFVVSLHLMLVILAQPSITFLVNTPV